MTSRKLLQNAIAICIIVVLIGIVFVFLKNISLTGYILGKDDPGSQTIIELTIIVFLAIAIPWIFRDPLTKIIFDAFGIIISGTATQVIASVITFIVFATFYMSFWAQRASFLTTTQSNYTPSSTSNSITTQSPPVEKTFRISGIGASFLSESIFKETGFKRTNVNPTFNIEIAFTNSIKETRPNSNLWFYPGGKVILKINSVPLPLDIEISPTSPLGGREMDVRNAVSKELEKKVKGNLESILYRIKGELK